MVDIQTIVSMLTPISLTAGVIYYIISIRNTQRNQELTLKAQQQNLETRQAQLFMNVYQVMMTKDFLEAEYRLYKVNLEKSEDWDALQSNIDDYRAFTVYATLFEGLGVLLKEGMLDVRLPAQMMSGPIIWFWDRYSKGIMDLRLKKNWAKFGVEIEYLTNKVIEYGRLHPDLNITSPEITK